MLIRGNLPNRAQPGVGPIAVQGTAFQQAAIQGYLRIGRQELTSPLPSSTTCTPSSTSSPPTQTLLRRSTLFESQRNTLLSPAATCLLVLALFYPGHRLLNSRVARFPRCARSPFFFSRLQVQKQPFQTVLQLPFLSQHQYHQLIKFLSSSKLCRI